MDDLNSAINRHVTRRVLPISFALVVPLTIYTLTGWGLETVPAAVLAMVLWLIIALSAAHGAIIRMQREARWAEAEKAEK